MMTLRNIVLKYEERHSIGVLARKSVKQSYHPTRKIFLVMEDFRRMVNDCIHIGLENGTSNLKRLSLLSYKELKRYRGYSQYRLTAISKASGILSARKKSIKRGYPTKEPYLSKPILVSCYGFKIEDGKLKFPLGERRIESVSLNAHTLQVLSDPSLRVNSFTLTENSLSICFSKEVQMMEELASTVGVDRNLRNLTVGNANRIVHYGVSKIVQIGENTRSILSSFKRNDVRIRKQISAKYGKRRSDRTKQILHIITKAIVQSAKVNRQAIVFEEIKGIRKLYCRGNGQGRTYRAKMNSWPFGEAKRQTEYKAAWEGVPVIVLSRNETRGTTMDCPRCGERLQEPVRGDMNHYRQLWCNVCKRWMDRDEVAVLNISWRGWVRFAQSKGEAIEAMVKERGYEPLILKVDASKLTRRGSQ